MGSAPNYIGNNPATPQPSRRRALLLTFTGVGACLGLCALLPLPSQLVWNLSDSVPPGIYRIESTSFERGDIIAIAPDDRLSGLLIRHGVLPRGKLLLKPVAALTGDVVCRHGASVTVNGREMARARVQVSDGRALPVWNGCQTLAAEQIFLLSNHPQSFDSRYFGPISTDQILGVANPVLLLSTGEAH